MQGNGGQQKILQPKNGGQHKDVTHPTGELIFQPKTGNGGQQKDVTHPTEEFCRGMVGNIKTLPTLQEN
ncbi:MAG: hypothetical protein DRR16_21650 [Candidatus Parabeggiatoa sp. nov. 3]|nr:MAG: hypothetical protein DRR00_02120 [Gammaproteobacteria bacterium]RKZ69448.1 MAG: hypothetical protein DRQ99_00925 [Gammaproteobacteria bacterium]RKZ81657.1 MAG: hypothetical protein DRR16_21650 [Gammaproteobacteria bacterium]